MRGRNAAAALALVFIAIVIQTTLFARVQPFGVAPELVLLTTIGMALLLPPEWAMVVGFSAGLLTDLLGSSLLGTWALVLTCAAYATARLRDRVEGNLFWVAAGVMVISAGAMVLFLVLSTLFGQQTISDAGALRVVLLVPVYNLILAAAVLPLVARLVRRQPRIETWS